MADDADLSIEEKRVYGDRTGDVTVFVASGMGVTTVHVSDDLVGEFALAERCDARDVARVADDAVSEDVAVATAEDVLLGRDGEGDEDAGETTFQPTGFGPAVAVSGDPLVAAGPDGRVARREDGEWVEVGDVGDVTAICGDLVATDGGVFQVVDDELRAVGLEAVRDVAAAGIPHAATASGLYRLGNGWMDVLDGDFRTVASDPATASAAGLGLAHAATPDKFYEHNPSRGDWAVRDLPVDERVVDVTHGPATYVLTAAGTLLVDAGDGWRHRSIGIREPRALATPPQTDAAR